MSNDKQSPVKMVTAAYLDPSYFAEEPVVPETPKTQKPQTNDLQKVMRVISCVMAITLVACFLLVAPDSMKLGATKKGRQQSGWLQLVAGGKKTRKQKLLEKIEKNRKISQTPSAEEKAELDEDSEDPENLNDD